MRASPRPWLRACEAAPGRADDVVVPRREPPGPGALPANLDFVGVDTSKKPRQSNTASGNSQTLRRFFQSYDCPGEVENESKVRLARQFQDTNQRFIRSDQDHVILRYHEPRFG